MPLRKRLFDLSLALGLSVVLAPVILTLMVWLLLRQGRPLFYAAERMKRVDRPFTLWKFRTMQVVQSDAGVSGGDKTVRITPTGRWLRKTRLDELPQLWNILRGDMSFVGPRPPLRQYVDQFPDLYRAVLQTRPGVTGLATLRFHRREAVLLAACQTAAETDHVYTRICVPRKARLDLIYQRHQSLLWDMALVVQTAWGVLRR